MEGRVRIVLIEPGAESQDSFGEVSSVPVEHRIGALRTDGGGGIGGAADDWEREYEVRSVGLSPDTRWLLQDIDDGGRFFTVDRRHRVSAGAWRANFVLRVKEQGRDRRFDSFTQRRRFARPASTAAVFGDRVYPVRSPSPSDDPLMIYAITGETREPGFAGHARLYTTFRIEVHARAFKDLHAADRAMVSALEATGRLQNLLTALDDFSEGLQPVQRTDFGDVAVETAEKVYRRIRSVAIH